MKNNDFLLKKSLYTKTEALESNDLYFWVQLFQVNYILKSPMSYI